MSEEAFGIEKEFRASLLRERNSAPSVVPDRLSTWGDKPPSPRQA